MPRNSEKIEAVLDSSAVLAVLRAETGHDQVLPVIARSLVSVVNEAEVISVLIQKGDSVSSAIAAVRELPYTLVDLDRESGSDERSRGRSRDE